MREALWSRADWLRSDFEERLLQPLTRAAWRLGGRLREHGDTVEAAAGDLNSIHRLGAFPSAERAALRALGARVDHLHQECLAVLNGSPLPEPFNFRAETLEIRDALVRAAGAM